MRLYDPGGLDALMQVIVCSDEIGWKAASRKLIVYSTDAGFHYAGDGKLAGIVEPNDAQCHLNAQRRYTHSLLHDYPSIGQINHKISQNNVNLIFAVVRDQAQLYKELSELIEGSFVGELDDDSSNIVQLVVDIYKTIAKKIVFAADSLPDSLSVRFFSKCQGEELAETSWCDGLKIKQQVDFEVELTMNECVRGPLRFNISAQGLAERVEVSVEGECECECEKESSVTSSGGVSPECNDRGRRVCGICQCEPLYYGSKCECSNLDSNDPNDKASAASNISSCVNFVRNFTMPKSRKPNITLVKLISH
ncbi:integrin beta-PS isoform X2 [Brachionus plicatilis]|uniref:Integrin beta n=1 Tax=Brachionus plicatilis TaxID=10195 RepID=A0A3M7PID0_BRAPC|nr:integrin beta-PS isoform X2 [Brachionus plicatilis]